MTGRVFISDGVELEVVWDGTGDLSPERPSRTAPIWDTAPAKRAWNKSGKYAKTEDYWDRKTKSQPKPDIQEELKEFKNA